MTSQPRPSELGAPLPSRQFWGFILFFHVVIVGMLGLTWYSHLRHLEGPPGRQDILLTVFVALQVLLYLICFVIPSSTGRLQLLGWGWWAYFIASVALVLAECRIHPAFAWALIPYVGQVSVLALRISVPVAVAILAAHVVNAATSRMSDELSALFGMITWFVLAFFLGRLVITSAERGGLILQLETAKRELEQSRQRDEELAVLHERERLARDLHDNLGHSLVTLTVQLQAAQRLQSTDPARAGALIEEMQKLTRASMDDLRRSLSNLRSPGLGDRRLTDALKTLCADSGRRFAGGADCRLADGADALPPIVAETLWRVAQEGLTNAEKHAQAHRVEMNLTLQSKEVLLRVSDDGIGLPPGAEGKPGHYGLRGLRERIEGLGGSFRAASDKGTVLEARIPIIA